MPIGLLTLTEIANVWSLVDDVNVGEKVAPDEVAGVTFVGGETDHEYVHALVSAPESEVTLNVHGGVLFAPVHDLTISFGSGRFSLSVNTSELVRPLHEGPTPVGEFTVRCAR